MVWFIEVREHRDGYFTRVAESDDGGGFIEGCDHKHPSREEAEACEEARKCCNTASGFGFLNDNKPTQPAQEPVVWQHKKPIMNTRGETIGYSDWKDGKGLEWWPKRALYTTPPSREWVSLTNEEILKVADEHPIEGFDLEMLEFVRAIEQKLKEKNYD